MTRRAFFWILAGLAGLLAGIWPKAKSAQTELLTPRFDGRFKDVRFKVTLDGETWDIVPLRTDAFTRRAAETDTDFHWQFEGRIA